MHDIIIGGGTVVDGTGGAPNVVDVAIAGGRIVAIGRLDDDAAETTDAAGALITPGFIDIRIHDDGQFVWDDALEPNFVTA